MTYVTRAEHRTYARWTVDGEAHAVATDEDVRGGVAHSALIVSDAELGERWIEEVASASDVRLTVVDRRGDSIVILDELDDPLLDERGDPLLTESPAYASLAVSVVEGLQVTIEVVTRVEFSAGVPFEHVRQRTLTCTAREFSPGAVTLVLSDIEDQRMNALYPPRVLETAQWQALDESDAGLAVARVFGTALKIQAARVTRFAPWRYVLLDLTDALAPEVLTVYRGSSLGEQRVVDPAEYTVGTASAPFPHLYLEFEREQRGFDGGLLIVTADVRDRGADAPLASALSAVAQVAGITLDSAGLTALDAWCVAQGRTVSCDFGRGGQRRTCRAIIEDLLAIASATLQRTPSGDYTFVTEAVAASIAVYDEDAGDAIEVLSVRQPARPSSVAINYRPGPREPDRLQLTQVRDVSGGSLGAERARPMRYVRSGLVADRVAAYRAARAEHADQLRLRVYRAAHSLGDVIEISSSAWGLYGTRWRVREAVSIVGGVDLQCTPYVTALFEYTPGALSPDAVADYTPDYSATPPAAPVFARVFATEVAIAADGAISASVGMRAGPPAGNWAALWVAFVHDVTGEISLQQLTTDIDGGQSAIVTGLRPGEPYQMLTYAENSFGIRGQVRAEFDAVSIGGGEADTVLTTAGLAAVPPNVASIAAVQIPPRAINVSWPGVTLTNLREYVLERNPNSTGWTQVWAGRGLSYVDRDVVYGNNYRYRVRARDTWGNVSSGFAESALVTLTQGTITGGFSGNDIGSQTVATANRTNVSTVSVGYGNITLLGASFGIVHGFGRVPIASANSTGKPGDWVNVDSVGTTSLGVSVYRAPNSASPDFAAPTNPHQHLFLYAAGGGTISVDLW